MIAIKRRKFTDTILKVVGWCCGIVVVVFGAVHELEADRVPAFERMVAWMHSVTGLVACIGTAAIATCAWLRRRYGNPWPWDAIQRLLDGYAQDLFRDRYDAAEPLDHHRVTLFKHCWFCPGLRTPKRWTNKIGRAHV